ncbi:MAG: 4-(cytidine 5'-diphospho)-2-C-methyl-D-erythritol kinase [Dehalococcoidales bacterium]|nr:4-(cytidine 5'-diphospho)-2-C-methyl-D-erythritol kinase [Dehalococcoidales bacterium]
MLTLKAPAKLNLTLEVLGKRKDGFHEVRSVIQTITLGDCLHFEVAQHMEYRVDMPGWAADKSLVSKAADLIRESSGYTQGAIIEVHKRVPLRSGLGGDSSDAATTLRGLNQLWGLGLSHETLQELAAQLGSDVAFFLSGGTALVRGKGEIVTSLPPLPRRWVVLIVPPVDRPPGKTERLYASLRANHYTRGEITEKLVHVLKTGREVIPSLLYNVFEMVAPDCFAGIEGYWRQFHEVGAKEVHLAGSGPSLFALIGDKTEAEKIYNKLQQSELESYLVETESRIKEATDG